MVTLDTSHFEMSELNASALSNAAESKKKRQRQRRKRQKVRGTNVNVNILEQTKVRRQRGTVVEREVS